MTKITSRANLIGKSSEEWGVVKLKDVAKIRGNKTVKGIERVAVIPMELVPDSGIFTEYKVVPIEQVKSSTYCEAGDILLAKITPSLENGKQGIVPFDVPNGFALATTEVFPIAPEEDKIDRFFLFYLLKFNKFRQKIIASMTGTTGRQRASKKAVENLLIPLPPLPEQKKIAEILRTVDEAIEKTDEAIERTERLKKGLMQRLLTKGIKHERFKKTELGEIPEEWEVVRVGEICQSIVPGRNKPKKFDGDIPWITLADIDGMYIGASKSGLNVSKEEIKRCGNKIIPPNSVIMSCVGKFGIVAITTREVVLNQQLHAFVCPKTLDPYFLAVALMFQARYMESIATKTTVPYLNKDKINSIPIPIPPLEEQKRIAEILMTVDRKLELLRKRREKLEKVKKGLMRDLLTGKKRVLVTTEKHK